MNQDESKLKLKYLGINTYNEPVVYIREDSHICKAEGFVAQARVRINIDGHSLIATLNTISSQLLRRNEASLSSYAWEFLKANEGDVIQISHPLPLDSINYIRSKLYGNELKTHELMQIILDLKAGLLSDIDIAMFLSAATARGLNLRETLDLTRAMVETGDQLSWPSPLIVDKHCVGGIPGNRTTLIVVPIVAAFGLMIPKTSSRAITSPAGTADTMEVFAPVNLNMTTMRKIVEKERGCIAWGGSVSLSPADDLLIRIERSMDLDSEGQLVASILSKKIAAGSNHLLIDIPIGPTAKIRDPKDAGALKVILTEVAKAYSLKTNVIITDGSQPVGFGIGPALEAKDVWAVLNNQSNAPQDLKDRALTIAGHIIEFSPEVKPGTGKSIAQALLENGQALKKFIAICEAQGGMFDIPKSKYQHTILACNAGVVTTIDNRHIARLAKLAGAPTNKNSGVELLVKVGTVVEENQPIYTIHAAERGELAYALSYLKQGHTIFNIKEQQ